MKKLVLIVCLAILLSAALRYASGATLTPASTDSQQSSSEHERAQAQELTQTLIYLSAQYQHANASNRDSLLLELERIAAERQEVLANLIATDPQAALSLALPVYLRESLPKDVQAYVEQEANVVGEFEVLFGDYNGSLLYFLNTRNERLPIYFASEPPSQYLTGCHVRAKGIVFERHHATTDGIVLERSLVLASGSSLKIKGIVFE